jgi:hypothetical protein
VISVDQPKGVLTNILFEPETFVSDSLTYDITAWAVPYFFGVQAYATTSLISVTKDETQSAFQSMEIPDKAYAFLFNWAGMDDARLLAQLLKANVKVRFTERELMTKGKSYKPGTLIVAKRDNRALGNRFESIVTQIANESQRSFAVINSGYMDGGPDLGSSDIRYLEAPKIAMLAGDGTYPLDYGATWYYLEQELGYPFAAIKVSEFGWVDLGQYNVLLMPEGRYSDFRDSDLEKITTWVREGGKLILIGDAIRKFADSDYASISKFNSDDEKRDFEKAQKKAKEEGKRIAYADREREYIKQMVPGAIFKVQIENTNPLAFGYGKSYYSLKTSADRYGLLNGNNVGVINSEADHMSGFAGIKVKQKVGNSMVFGVEEKGRGSIVYMVDNPLFRAFWYDAKLLVANAIFFVGQ